MLVIGAVSSLAFLFDRAGGRRRDPRRTVGAWARGRPGFLFLAAGWSARSRLCSPALLDNPSRSGSLLVCAREDCVIIADLILEYAVGNIAVPIAGAVFSLSGFRELIPAWHPVTARRCSVPPEVHALLQTARGRRRCHPLNNWRADRDGITRLLSASRRARARTRDGVVKLLLLGLRGAGRVHMIRQLNRFAPTGGRIHQGAASVSSPTSLRRDFTAAK